MAAGARMRVKPVAGAARRAADVPLLGSALGTQMRAGEGRTPVGGADGPDARDRRAQIAEIQRARLLAAAARVLDELGYTQATVAHITRRSRVSRRTFYELFGDREECFVAVLEDAAARVQGDLRAANLEGLSWLERIRVGLRTILAFFDREPALARVCVVQSLRGGPTMLARREQLLAELAAAVDGGRAESARAAELPALTAQGLVGAAVGILYSRLLAGGRGSLCALQGELMAMIALPYLGASAARREQAREIAVPASRGRRREPAGGDPLEGLAMRVTYRTARVLEGVAELPGASNRQVADFAGIHDPGQVSRLLARLEGLGLVTNGSPSQLKGEPNVWTLTPRGEQVTQSIRAHTATTPPAAGRARR